MSARKDYILDTGILVHYIRGSDAYQAIEAKYQLVPSAFQPMVCVVSLGEIRAFGISSGWGSKKFEQLDKLFTMVTVVDIDKQDIIHEYARLSVLAKSNGWALLTQKNDLWIAAVANVTGATLLTFDKDFDGASLAGELRSVRFDADTGQEVKRT